MNEGGAPVQGALVFVVWRGSTGYNTTVCYHTASAVTDKHGHYRIEGWRTPSPIGGPVNRGYISHRSANIDVLAPNLVRVSTHGGSHIRVDHFKGTRKERLDYLHNATERTECFATDEASKNASLAALRAIYAEAESIAKTPVDKYRNYGILRRIEEKEFGYYEAERRYKERVAQKPGSILLRPSLSFGH